MLDGSPMNFLSLRSLKMSKSIRLIEFLKEILTEQEVKANSLTSHRYHFTDSSGFWICDEENRISVFGTKESLMYRLMEEIGEPLKNQGTEIYQISLYI